MDDDESIHCNVPVSYSMSFCWNPVNAEVCVYEVFLSCLVVWVLLADDLHQWSVCSRQRISVEY